MTVSDEKCPSVSPAPHLIWTSGPQPWHGSWFLWWPCTTPPVNLAVRMENSVKAALGADIQPAIGQDRHDLAWRKRCKYRFVAGEQDSLAFLWRGPQKSVQGE